MRDIVETATWLKNNPDRRCIVLSGEGRAFCADLNMSGFENMVNGQSSELVVLGGYSICSSRTKMSVMEMKCGLNPDMAGAALMYHLASEEILMQESVLQDELLKSDNQIEVVTAALEKRPANFKNGKDKNSTAHMSFK